MATVDPSSRLILDVGQRTVISSQNVVLGLFLIAMGLVQVFFGFKFIRLTLVLTGFVSWALVAAIIMVAVRWDLSFYLVKPSKYYFWMWFLAGILGAVLSFRFWNLGVCFAGGFGGFAVAMGIIAAVDSDMSTTGRYILLAFFILIGAAIATFYERFSIIIGTSAGGAFMVMYGIDEFVQVGYREMIVIFDFVGKTLTYRPTSKAYVMIGCSFALALCGIAWEFWHHAKPMLVDRKALFRIYGRPFGKHPQKLVGQKLKRRMRSMEWYIYLTGCMCLRRKTAEEVLYGRDDLSAAAGSGALVVVVDDQQEHVQNEHQSGNPVEPEAKEHGQDENACKDPTSVKVAPISSNASSKTASCHASERLGENTNSITTLSPAAVKVVIEEVNYHTEGAYEETAPVVITDTYVTVINDSSPGTMAGHESSTRAEHHSSSSTSTATATTTQTTKNTTTSTSTGTTSATSMTNTSHHTYSSRSESRHHTTSTSAFSKVVPSDAQAVVSESERPGLAIISRTHQHHSTASTSTSTSTSASATVSQTKSTVNHSAV
ncbi:hypothetical protein BG011_000136 [Mortierella polycephala]|uniref:Transmembrane protein 198 n=1 Tax=Mortierella polycephala TaxID=41804 RepID=A0A9P6PM17_9FUNG|nr:hypothetical protein BG011_000136 [Mortierella polycephala]